MKNKTTKHCKMFSTNCIIVRKVADDINGDECKVLKMDTFLEIVRYKLKNTEISCASHEKRWKSFGSQSSLTYRAMHNSKKQREHKEI